MNLMEYVNILYHRTETILVEIKVNGNILGKGI